MFPDEPEECEVSARDEALARGRDFLEKLSHPDVDRIHVSTPASLVFNAEDSDDAVEIPVVVEITATAGKVAIVVEKIGGER